jgi:NADH-quinone oxidoreductase subunit L
MEHILSVFIALPFIGFITTLFIRENNEKAISWIAFCSLGFQLFFGLLFILFWCIGDVFVYNTEVLSIYSNDHYRFALDLMFDKITAVYFFLGAFLTFLVTIYSRYYLHREKGYKRFFSTILFFFVGYNLTIFSGNLETLFAGWEILGISSFLLIAYYRNRYLPVKNAIKVFSIYRIGDVGLLLAMWMSHHFWHANITFIQLSNFATVSEHLQSHSLIGVFISLMILVSAAAKSAQLPFSSWLPRAMEGPTPSTAIFYGSLSVHMGIFLLLKTLPFWEHQLSVRILIGIMGLITTFITTGIARVQSSVKSQIAYSSIAQIGLIFIELAFGFENLALFHFAGNAFLRTYQLLVSPSVVSYLIREQFYEFSPRKKTIESFLPIKWQYTFYMLSIKEWNLDTSMYKYLWNPMKVYGKRLDFLTLRRLLFFFIPTYLLGLLFYFFQELIPLNLHHWLPELFALLGLVMVMKAFAERKHARLSWILVVLNHFWIALSISFNESFSYIEVLIYLSGIVVSGIIGYICLKHLKSVEKSTVNLMRFHGHIYEHPRIALLFFISCLGLTGFPITPTFLGEDLIYSHIHQRQILLASLVSISFILDGLAIIRIYGRVFLGPHLKAYHEIAYRSS